ncbi:MAG TPA: beta-L-arabinofuranosidase domain-containing protein, partial [Gemmatimonadaceae bacterium]|nr:beta-L-arabinofuranosidase domain-containing protein [Gemmatimonadaceae bacterium]
MTISRRAALKLGLTAGAVPLLAGLPLGFAEAELPTSPPRGSARLQARRIPLHRVRLTGGPLRHAQELDIKYLLELEPDRMLAYFRERAGLTPRAQPYGGWDGDGRNLTGHIAGHYLSAISLMWSATGDRRFKARGDYIVAELKTVQDKNGNGYLCALENGHRCFGELARGQIRAAAFDLNGEWSPWYTVHKLFAGLRDTYRHMGNRTALDVEVQMATWTHGVLSGLTDEQIQHMLDTEFGGMNEVLVDLAADTGDPRWLTLSYDFEHRAFIQPLQRSQDDLGGKHANCSIPKLIGSAHRYVTTGRAEDLLASSFFWNRVADHHSFATGGSGTDEYWGPADVLGARIDGRTAESCPVYNMLKLSRLLFSVWPDVHYADFHERMLFNHALGSIDPNDGRMCYMVPVGQGVTHEYQRMFESFTCCVGTGMENHALHGDGVYFEDG